MSQSIDDLVLALEESAEDLFWFGPPGQDRVQELEQQLGCQLPRSFERFLVLTGGGGVEGSEISGISPSADSSLRGTVLGDTLRCRVEFALPSHLVVVYFSDDEICWCLDTMKIDTADAECPVVSYNLALRRVDSTIAATFADYLSEYVRHQTE